MSIGQRIKEERERLGLNQTDFGSSAGVGRKSQFNYESGEHAPDADYLAAIAAMGADIYYIVTGIRGGQPPLKADETVLLDNYRHSPEEQQRLLRETSAAFAKPKVKRGKAA